MNLLKIKYRIKIKTKLDWTFGFYSGNLDFFTSAIINILKVSITHLVFPIFSYKFTLLIFLTEAPIVTALPYCIMQDHHDNNNRDC